MLSARHAGERETLDLAPAIGAELVLMDDRARVATARAQGFLVTGTLGVLDRAARYRLVDIGAAVARLRETNFRISPALLEAMVERHRTS